MPQAIRLVRMPESIPDDSVRYHYELQSWQWYPSHNQLDMRRMGFGDRAGTWYWCKSDTPHPCHWREVRVSDVPVDLSAPLKTPDWANGVVWIKDGYDPFAT